MMGGWWVINYKKMKDKDRREKNGLHLSISLVILPSPFNSLCFLFPRLSPHLSLSLSPPCSFLMLSPLTPLGSLSLPAFSWCSIYSLFNSLCCICSPFLLLRRSFSFRFHHVSPSLFTHLHPSLLYRHLFKMPLVLHRFYGQFISLGGGFHFLYNSYPVLSVMQAITFIS